MHAKHFPCLTFRSALACKKCSCNGKDGEKRHRVAVIQFYSPQTWERFSSKRPPCWTLGSLRSACALVSHCDRRSQSPPLWRPLQPLLSEPVEAVFLAEELRISNATSHIWTSGLLDMSTTVCDWMTFWPFCLATNISVAYTHITHVSIHNNDSIVTHISFVKLKSFIGFHLFTIFIHDSPFAFHASHDR